MFWAVTNTDVPASILSTLIYRTSSTLRHAPQLPATQPTNVTAFSASTVGGARTAAGAELVAPRRPLLKDILGALLRWRGTPGLPAHRVRRSTIRREVRLLDLGSLEEVVDCLAVALEGILRDDVVGFCVVDLDRDGAVVVEVAEVGFVGRDRHHRIQFCVISFDDGVLDGELTRDAGDGQRGQDDVDEGFHAGLVSVGRMRVGWKYLLDSQRGMRAGLLWDEGEAEWVL